MLYIVYKTKGKYDMLGFKSLRAKINAENRYLNRKFGRLRVINIFMENGKLMADCVCDCGNMKTSVAYNLWTGMTKSCGCLRNDRIIESQQVVPSEDVEKIRREYFDKKRNKMVISYAEIARRYGVSRQRIYQLVRGK